MKTLVLGVGNELYGDDGVGIYVVRKLKEELAAEKNHLSGAGEVIFEECSLTGIAILDIIIGYDKLVIIDTIKKANPISGRIHSLEEHNLRNIPGPSPHYVSIPQTLAIGRKLGLRVPSKIKIVAVEAKNIYNLGEGLSQEMKKALPKIISQVKKVLQSI